MVKKRFGNFFSGISKKVFGFGKSNTKKKQSDMDFYARVSSLAYEKPGKREGKMNELGLKGYKVDNQLSNKDSVVIYNPEEKKVITGFRGTDFSNRKKGGRDFGTDLLISLGLDKLGSRNRNSTNLVKQVMSKYEGFTPTLTGHSLGAKMSNDIGRKLNLESHSFNLPASLRMNLPSLKGSASNSRQNIYTTAGDPIGALGLLKGSGDKVLIKPSTNNPHGLENFLRLN